MENQALSIMKPQIERLENYPELEARLRQHVTETEGQIQRLDDLLGRMGESPSGLKDTLLSAVGGMAALGHSFTSDEVVKNSFANFAFENFEIAAYRSLMTLARHCGEQDAMQALEANLREEEAMADWIEQNLESVTQKYVSLTAAGERAKT
jgi:ferritin-like metal-binding protein YciE